VIWHKNAKAWTKAEKERADRAMRLGCIHCWLNFGAKIRAQELHHILRGSKRMGHWWSLPLCKACHVAAHNSTFKRAEQIDRWIKTQHILGLDDSLPKSKIVPRRAA